MNQTYTKSAISPLMKGTEDIQRVAKMGNLLVCHNFLQGSLYFNGVNAS
jgi:hypothetical protein